LLVDDAFISDLRDWPEFIRLPGALLVHAGLPPNQNPEDVASTELDLNLDKHYTEVDNVNEVLIDLTATVIQKTILGAIGNDLGGFIQDLTEGSEDAGIDLKEEAEKFEEQFKGLMKQFR